MPETPPTIAPNQIPGLTPDQANMVVELAGQMNNIRSVVALTEGRHDWIADAAKAKYAEKDQQVSEILQLGETALTGQAVRPEYELAASTKRP
jgi:hypothetical protein